MSEILGKDKIRALFLAAGFTVKDGHDDLKPYVYDAARAVERAVVEKLAAMGGELPGAVAYAAGLDARMNGFIDTKAWSEGEFTDPLYTADQLRVERAKGVAAGMAQSQRWIPVGALMPKEGEVVAVLTAQGERLTAWATHWRGAASGFAEWTFPSDDMMDSTVAYWHALPPAPDDKEQTR